jgi:solute:Na+ symporter, SSS family
VNLTFLDWTIVLCVLAGMFVSVMLSRGLMRGVADFLVAGRSAGRYVISISSGVAGLGAITIVSFLEMNYISGFAMSWWGMSMALVLLFITVSGWVIYRFRQTRCLTLAQFFEMRYSRSFRVFTGLVAFLAGLVNFGIFPAVGARFFIAYCGFPESVSLLGLSIGTYPLLMLFLLSISLFFVYTGGQIAVIIADFFQGVFVNIVFVVMIIYLFLFVDWSQVQTALSETPIKEAQKEIVQVVESPEFQVLSPVDQEEKLVEIRERHDNASRINPFKTSHVEDFNFWFFMIGVIGVMYGTMSWQGTQAYNASARSAHEAKMGSVLAGFRGLPQTLFFLFVPIVAYTIMNHADFAGIASDVNAALNLAGSSTLQGQLRVPIVLAHVLPVGLVGAFAAVMLAAFVSTHDTYLHSWGSILVQDVIMPFRKEPFTPKQHLFALRASIFLVAVFIFFFSLLFEQTQAIALFFAITGAIFAGGSGAVIIGGLYWKRGTTQAAWVALSLGALVAVGGIVMQQIDETWLHTPNYDFLKQAILVLRGINGQVYWAIGMATSSLAYVVVSLLTSKKPFEMDRLLHRGEFLLETETRVVQKNPVRGWRFLGIGREFTKTDKLIYLVNYVWTFGWVAVFVIGTLFNLSHETSDATWMSFWRIYLLIHIAMAVVAIVWFTIGGMIDMRKMFAHLKGDDRDDGDDGFVRRAPVQSEGSEA